MKKLSGGVLFSALSLLLLLSCFLILFLEDYKLKGEFQIKLARYYIAVSMKEWAEEKYLLGAEHNFFNFQEGSVTLYTYNESLEKIEYSVQIKGDTFKFYGKTRQTTSETVTSNTTESSEFTEVSESSEASESVNTVEDSSGSFSIEINEGTLTSTNTFSN